MKYDCCLFNIRWLMHIIVTSAICLLPLIFSINISIPVNAADNDTCVICNGTGICNICEGEGILSNGTVSIDCTGCTSTGKCKYCNGTGTKNCLTSPVISAQADGSNVVITYNVTDTRSTGITIYRLEPDGKEYSRKFLTALNGTYTDQAAAGCKYTYYARNTDINNCYGISNSVDVTTVLSSNPTIIKNKSVSLSNAVKLQIAVPNDVKTVNVYRSALVDGTYDKITTIDNNSETIIKYYDTNLNINTKYYYKVSGLSSYGIEGIMSKSILFDTTQNKTASNKAIIPSFAKFSGSKAKIKKGISKGSGAAYKTESYHKIKMNMAIQYMNLLSKKNYSFKKIEVYNEDNYVKVLFDYKGKTKIQRGAGNDMINGLEPCDLCLSYSIKNNGHLSLQYSKQLKAKKPVIKFNIKKKLTNKYFKNTSKSNTTDTTDTTNTTNTTDSSSKENSTLSSYNNNITPPKTFTDDRCLACNGTGDCHVCWGNTRRYITGYDQPGTYVYCQGCHGTNKCFKCGGTGKAGN